LPASNCHPCDVLHNWLVTLFNLIEVRQTHPNASLCSSAEPVLLSLVRR
jgi:hypothetical protein